MPVNAPKGKGRVTSQRGIVSGVRGGIVEVTMDESGIKVTFTAESMEEANS